ncbi:MAG TPA: hypothetical protein VHK90_16410, partial [Thermoanaerobaculia bacterium]|nr:hypothetical protein [Thermoanaerobaculia bacterium]
MSEEPCNDLAGAREVGKDAGGSHLERMLSVQQRRHVSERYPYPIARWVKLLSTPEYARPSRDRLDRTHDAAEGVARFLAAILIGECRTVLEQHASSSIPGPLKRVPAAMQSPTFGQWVSVARELAAWLHTTGATPTISPLLGFFLLAGGRAAPGILALDRLKEGRNKLEHFKNVPETPDEIEAACDDAIRDLDEVLTELAWMERVSLMQMCEIRVQKRRRYPPRFEHLLSQLSGPVPDGEAATCDLPEYRESEAVTVQFDGGDGYVNLEPLYVFEKNAGSAPDLFFLNGVSNGALEYVGCKVGKKFLTSDVRCRRREELRDELQYLLLLFSGKAYAETAS